MRGASFLHYSSFLSSAVGKLYYFIILQQKSAFFNSLREIRYRFFSFAENMQKGDECMNFGKGKSDILFSLICIWAIIFFSAAFTAIGAAASHSEWVLTHAETEQESVAAESEDEAVEANGDIEIRAEKADDADVNGIRAIISASVFAVISGAVTACALRRHSTKE